MHQQTWQPRNPEYQAVVRESFARQSMMSTLGAQIEHIGPGEIHLRAPSAPQFAQQNGFWHAGAISSLADSANGYAALTLAPSGFDVLAVEFKINLLAPARGESFLAQGRVVRPGRTLSVCLAEVFAVDGGESILIATMLSTIIMRRPASQGDSETVEP